MPARNSATKVLSQFADPTASIVAARHSSSPFLTAAFELARDEHCAAKYSKSLRFADESLGADIIGWSGYQKVDWYRVAVVNRDEVGGFGCSALGNVAV
jgi:hypothetical protein